MAKKSKLQSLMMDFVIGEDKDEESFTSLIDIEKDTQGRRIYREIEKGILDGKGMDFIMRYRHENLRKVCAFLNVPYRSQMTRKVEYAESILGYVYQKHNKDKIAKKMKKKDK